MLCDNRLFTGKKGGKKGVKKATRAGIEPASVG